MSSIHDPRYKKIIDGLISTRESLNITQVQLAATLKRPQSYIAKVENLDRRIDLIELLDWLNALNIQSGTFLILLQQLRILSSE
ncbi:helix-turn-helix domain-containing protein [Acinetobacter sp. NIOH-H-8]|uniref:helix-turn-helix domain-containing protein n=1 Tax=Acinetobacter sp. NIOH-H-8 TaxID=3342120 RepID=UPI003988667C